MSIIKNIKKVLFYDDTKHKSIRDIGENKEEVIAVLITHPILEELREWSSYRSKVLDIKDPTKKKMAEYYLSLFFGRLRDAVVLAIEKYEIYLDDAFWMENAWGIYGEG